MKKTRLRKLVTRGLSTQQIADKLNCSKTNVRYWLKKHDLQTIPSKGVGTQRFITREELETAVRRNVTMAGTLRELGFNANGGVHGRMTMKIKNWEIDTSHWLGSGYATKGRAAWNRGQGKPLSEVMVRDSTYSRCSLKRRIAEEGLLKPLCSDCGLDPNWQKKPLVLVLDHINGINNDHRLENLRLLCPNCNSQTPTFSGRNRKR